MNEIMAIFDVFLLKTRESIKLTSRICQLIEWIYFDDFG